MDKDNLDYKIIMMVVNTIWSVNKRVAKLRELGYIVTSEWVKSGGVGTIRKVRGLNGVQVSAAIGGNNFVGSAWVAFNNNNS